MILMWELCKPQKAIIFCMELFHECKRVPICCYHLAAFGAFCHNFSEIATVLQKSQPKIQCALIVYTMYTFWYVNLPYFNCTNLVRKNGKIICINESPWHQNQRVLLEHTFSTAPASNAHTSYEVFIHQRKGVFQLQLPYCPCREIKTRTHTHSTYACPHDDELITGLRSHVASRAAAAFFHLMSMGGSRGVWKKGGKPI